MNRTSGNRRIARKAAIVATALGLWGALVLLFAAPLALPGRISWREAVSFGASFWALWLLFELRLHPRPGETSSAPADYP